MNSRRIIGISIAGLFVLLAGFCLWTAGIVGGHLISRQDVAFKNELNLLYTPEDKRDLGYFQLAKSYAHLAILEKFGVPVTSEMIEKEVVRIDQQTHDEQKLRQIKDIFKGNESAYRRVFVVPTLVDRMIYYDFYLNNENLHAGTQSQAETFLNEAKNNPGLNFQDEAKKRKLPFQKLILSEDTGFRAETPLSEGERKEKERMIQERMAKLKKKFKGKIPKPGIRPDAQEEFRAWYESFLKNMKIGDVIDKPISRGDMWLVIRLKEIQEEPKRFIMDSVFFPKDDYSQWEEKERKNIFIFPQPRIPAS